MNSFELNKILGAVLGTCLVLLALNIAASAIFAPEKPAKPGYAIAALEHPGKEGPAAPAAPEPAEPIAVLLAKASVERGQASAKKCVACHTFEKSGPNRVGPNLWNIVGRPKASVPGFNYSAAMKAKGGEWTFEELNPYLANPRGIVPGTIMTFAGVTRDSERADLIAYLRTLADNPLPLPLPAAAQSPAGAAPAQPK
ncbi:MAG: cytochrome c family protein [Xanthobacteraceae bacterium]